MSSFKTKGIFFALCTVSIICFTYGLETPVTREVDESFRNISRCSVTQDIESCATMCIGYDKNLCHHTRPTQQKSQCFCKNNAATTVIKEEITQPSLAPCENNMNIKCEEFCTRINKDFLVCEQGTQDPAVIRCRCTRRA